MSLTLYMDVHVPRAITNGLRQRGIEVITAQWLRTVTHRHSNQIKTAR